MYNVLEYLENSADKYPNKIAVVDASETCTYAELLDKSRIIGSNLLQITENNKASELKSKSVAVFMDKSVKALQAFMGIVYAQGFYTLIDPSFPEDRINKMLEVLETTCIITNKKYKTKLELMNVTATILDIDELLVIFNENTSVEMLSQNRDSYNVNMPLYCNFTSGSTGVPKGVLISHSNVINFIDNFTKTFGITSEDVIGNQAPFDFDVSVKDIYSCLKTGATLVIIPKSYFMFPNQVVDMLEEYKVTTLIWAVSALVMLNRLKALKYKVPSAINKIMFSGEVMPVRQLNEWKQYYKDAMFVNLYGPTEITCNCMYYIVDREFNEDEKLPLGKKFEHSEVFLLDDKDNVVLKDNISHKGEICVAGKSLAINYYNNDKATKKAFVQYAKDGVIQRIYRTGDMAYYNEEGDMFFAGRKDFQIKHMGHRIELEEIEKAMSNVSIIEQACCFFDEEQHRVIAYFVGLNDKREIVNQMRKKVPDYMVPNVFKTLDRMPLNKNGKMDRALLKTLYKESVNSK